MKCLYYNGPRFSKPKALAILTVYFTLFAGLEAALVFGTRVNGWALVVSFGKEMSDCSPVTGCWGQPGPHCSSLGHHLGCHAHGRTTCVSREPKK